MLGLDDAIATHAIAEIDTTITLARPFCLDISADCLLALNIGAGCLFDPDIDATPYFNLFTRATTGGDS